MLKMCRLYSRLVLKSTLKIEIMCKLLKCPVQNVATTFCFQNNQLKMIAGDILPISVVEAKGFRGLIAFLEPDYTVPCRQTMTAGEHVQRSSRLAR